MSISSNKLRTLVRAAYDLQKLRIQLGNRVVGNFKVKLGQDPGKLEDVLDAEGKLILLRLRKSHRKITDGVKTFPRYATFKGDGIIEEYGELLMIDSYVQMEKQEKDMMNRFKKIVQEFPIWDAFFKNVKGCGETMAAVLICEVDVAKARHISSLWKYAGLDVAPDGAGRSKRSEHLVQVEYEAASGKTKERLSITYNPFLKTKLMGVLTGCLLKAKDNNYCIIYNSYKQRLENHAVYGIANEPVRKEEWKKKYPSGKPYAPKAHRHNMAMRYMIKQFLADLWVVWRELEGLPVTKPYAEAKLGRAHGQS